MKPFSFGSETPFILPESAEAAETRMTTARTVPKFTADSTGKVSVAFETKEPRIDWIETVGPEGERIRVKTADGKIIPGTAMPIKEEPRRESFTDTYGNVWSRGLLPSGKPDPSDPGRLDVRARQEYVQGEDAQKRPILIAKPNPEPVNPWGGAAKAPGAMPSQKPTGAGVVQLGSAPGDVPMTDEQRRARRNLRGELPPAGMTQNEAESKGYKLQTGAQIETEGAINVTKNVLKDLQGLAFGEGGIWTDIPDTWAGRVAYAAKLKKAEIEQKGVGQKVKLYQDNLGAFGGGFARTVMQEKGVLTEPDLRRVMKAFPVVYPVPDSRDIATRKMGAVANAIDALQGIQYGDNKSANGILGKLEAEVSAIEKGGLGPVNGAIPSKGSTVGKYEIRPVRP
jgi:hypothetical protein